MQKRIKCHVWGILVCFSRLFWHLSDRRGGDKSVSYFWKGRSCFTEIQPRHLAKNTTSRLAAKWVSISEQKSSVSVCLYGLLSRFRADQDRLCTVVWISPREAAGELKHLVCIADVARRLRISAIECHVFFCSLVSFFSLNLDSKCWHLFLKCSCDVSDKSVEITLHHSRQQQKQYNVSHRLRHQEVMFIYC